MPYGVSGGGALTAAQAQLAVLQVQPVASVDWSDVTQALYWSSDENALVNGSSSMVSSRPDLAAHGCWPRSLSTRMLAAINRLRRRRARGLRAAASCVQSITFGSNATSSGGGISSYSTQSRHSRLTGMFEDAFVRTQQLTA